MMIRKTPLITNEIYHVYNRSVAQQPIFTGDKECRHCLDLINFYRFKDNSLRLSYFSRLPAKNKEKYLSSQYLSEEHVKVLSFCIMPNHYHFLLEQSIDFGITNFLKLVQNGYAKYFNIKLKRSGALFFHSFKAVGVENEEQFLYTARYIHLNPLTSFLLKAPEELKTYEWSSYFDYISDNPRPFIDTEKLTSLLKTKDAFARFTLNQLDYQRKLEQIKHLCFED